MKGIDYFQQYTLLSPIFCVSHFFKMFLGIIRISRVTREQQFLQNLFGRGGGGARMLKEKKEKFKIILSVLSGEHRFQKNNTQYPTQPFLIFFKYMTFV